MWIYLILWLSWNKQAKICDHYLSKLRCYRLSSVKWGTWIACFQCPSNSTSLNPSLIEVPGSLLRTAAPVAVLTWIWKVGVVFLFFTAAPQPFLLQNFWLFCILCIRTFWHPSPHYCHLSTPWLLAPSWKISNHGSLTPLTPGVAF